MKSQEYFATDVSEHPNPAFLCENRVKVGASRLYCLQALLCLFQDKKPGFNHHYSMKLLAAVNFRVCAG